MVCTEQGGVYFLNWKAATLVFRTQVIAIFSFPLLDGELFTGAF